MIENIKIRLAAKKFNFITDKIDSKRKADSFLGGYWISKGNIYFGHPLLVFFISCANQRYQDGSINSSR